MLICKVGGGSTVTEGKAEALWPSSQATGSPSTGLRPIPPASPTLPQLLTHILPWPLTFHCHLCSLVFAARPEGGSGRGRRAERGSPSRSNEVISPEILKMRAALFCIFTYLDTRTLLHAAEVCRDWRFVARHPAVWTRVLLENARVCSKVPASALLGTHLSPW